MSAMERGAMPKPSEQAKAAFAKVVPDRPTVTLRPMFGNLAAFVNGNMFAGLFGEDLFVRLPEDESANSRIDEDATVDLRFIYAARTQMPQMLDL